MSDNYDRILGGLGVTTTTTPATVAHACALAGGIRASLDPAVFGWTLTISDELRSLTLTLLPEQVAEMATWREQAGGAWDCAPTTCTTHIIGDCVLFMEQARTRLGWGYVTCGNYVRADIVSLRGLAAAALGEGDR